MTPALAAVQEAAQSKVPVLGYTVPYATGQVLLTDTSSTVWIYSYNGSVGTAPKPVITAEAWMRIDRGGIGCATTPTAGVKSGLPVKRMVISSSSATMPTSMSSPKR